MKFDNTFWKRIKFLLFLIEDEDTEFINLPDTESTFQRAFRIIYR